MDRQKHVDGWAPARIWGAVLSLLLLAPAVSNADNGDLVSPAIPTYANGAPIISSRDDLAAANLTISPPVVDTSNSPDATLAAIDFNQKATNIINEWMVVFKQYLDREIQNKQENAANNKILTTPKEKQAEKTRYQKVRDAILKDFDHAIQVLTDKLIELGLQAAFESNKLKASTPTTPGWQPIINNNYLYTVNSGTQASSYFFPSWITRNGRRYALNRGTVHNGTVPSASYNSDGNSVEVPGSPFRLGVGRTTKSIQ